MQTLPGEFPRPYRLLKVALLAVLVLLLASSVTIADFIVEYNWWKEIGQVDTWVRMLLYSIAPAVVGSVLGFWALWVAHSQGLRFAAIRSRHLGLYSVLVPIGLGFLAILFASGSLDSSVVMRYLGSIRIPASADSWRDPVFSHPLPFYLFQLPFYSEVLGFLFGLWFLCGLVFWVTGRGWQLVTRVRSTWNRETPELVDLDFRNLLLPGASRSGFFQVMSAALLLLLAVWCFLGNYDLLLNRHSFMTGADYVDEKIVLPLRWLLIAVLLAAIPLVWRRAYTRSMILVGGGFVLFAMVPGLVRFSYVRPNEISLERPYIERHLEATSTAFGLNRHATTRIFPVSDAETVDPTQHSTLLENIRLWDWRAYTDTITQIQALRPYYTFPDTDVDRYIINGRIKQVLLSPREIDVDQLPADASQSWVNPHLVYTHGFGVVMSEVNKTTSDGLPLLLIEDAPPEVKLPGFQLTQPQLYYGERTQDPVFVNTAQEEFDYPAGDQNKYSRYQGDGGFPIGSFLMKTAAALALGDSNILFTHYFTPQSRMMIHRDVRDRLEHVASFIRWDGDPYLVITDAGKLVWMIDGYTLSRSYPYSASLPVAGVNESANYIRNAVKATVDAYTGKISLYVFDPSDPIIQVYEELFPSLFRPASEMPPDLRRHARYPESLFRTQAEAYRSFHMRDPQVFYNKEDVWDIARSLYGQSGRPEPMSPTYIVATLPGEPKPEFLLMLPFSPRGKDNLIGWMAARCDGDHLNELVFFQLSKQQLVYGPMQIESRIDQDQNISKDLSLWNQQGSHVLRGSLIALPLSDSFLYVESIYIQATEARMPQLKKVVLAMGNRLIYSDTFDEAMAKLTSEPSPAVQPVEQTASPPVPPPTTTERSSDLTKRLQRLHDQAGKLLEEIEAIQKEAAHK